MNKLWIGAVLVVCGLYISCSQKPCNNVPQNPYIINASPTPTPPPHGADDFKTANIPKVSPTPAPLAVPSGEPKEPTVQVFKSTGEVQCEQGRGVPLERMQETIQASKIKIYSAHTQSDGMLHMAVCGASAGSIHVFKIPQKDLKKAEKLGFKLFKPRKE